MVWDLNSLLQIKTTLQTSGILVSAFEFGFFVLGLPGAHDESCDESHGESS